MNITSTYQDIIFARCLVGHEASGNSISALIGRTGVGPAFGGEFGIKLRPIGGDVQTHWGTFHFARGVGKDSVAEYNGSAPYTTLNQLGMTDAQVNALKTVLVAECYPRETHERGFRQWLTDTGYEVMP